MVKKIQVAKEAGLATGSDFIICARSDARGVLGL